MEVAYREKASLNLLRGTKQRGIFSPKEKIWIASYGSAKKEVVVNSSPAG